MGQRYGGDMYIHMFIPIPNWKSQEFPIPMPSQCGDSFSKRGRIQTVLTGHIYLPYLAISNFFSKKYYTREVYFLNY